MRCFRLSLVETEKVENVRRISIEIQTNRSKLNSSLIIHEVDKQAENAYTRRFFGGRHPLCGTGVTSRIKVIPTPVA